MKKLILIIFLLIIPTICFALGPAMVGMLGGSGAASTTYTDCSQIGTHAFVWFGDYTGDADKGCKGSSTAIDGALSGTASVVASGTDPGTASPTSAGNALKLAASNDYLRWPITTEDILSSAEGKVCFDFYVSASTGNNVIYLTYTNGGNADKITFNSTNTIWFQHIGNSVSTAVISVAKFTDATWTNACVRWSVANNQVGIKVGAGSWVTACASGCDQTDSDAVTAHASEPSYLYMGYGALTAGEYVYIDNLTIDKTSGL